MIFIAIRGATAWEMQIGRLWLAIRYPGFWRTSWPGWVTITDPSDDNLESEP